MSSQNNVSTSPAGDSECNGGVGFHQPSHFVKVDTQVDEHGTHVADGVTNKSQKAAVVAATGSASSKRPSKICHRKWTPKERYLLMICGVLFISCVAFIFIAFFRDKIISDSCPCQGKLPNVGP